MVEKDRRDELNKLTLDTLLERMNDFHKYDKECDKLYLAY